LLGTNPYDGADLFAVVRDVKERLVSEFYYICRKKVNKNWKAIECDQEQMYNPKYLNEWLEDKLQRTPTTNMSAEDYLDHNGHFTAQSDFIFAPSSVRMMDYVLRMDSLQRDFSTLMGAYHLDIKLPADKKNTARNNNTDLGIESIGHKLMNLIHEKYQKDFDLFV
jgi:hypothetical protein